MLNGNSFLMVQRQLYPWFGKISARTDAAAKKAEAAKQKYQAARLSLLREVKGDFYEYSYLARAMTIARANLDLLKRFEEITRTKYVTADTGHPDVNRSQAETAKIETVLKGLEQLREDFTAGEKRGGMPISSPRHRARETPCARGRIV